MWIKDFSAEKDNPLKVQPFVVVTHLCYSDILPKWEYPWHAHTDEFEVTFVMSGQGILTINGTDTAVKEGDIYVIPPGVYHRNVTKTANGMDYLVMRFDSQPLDGDMQSFFGSLGSAVTSAGSYMEFFKCSANLLLNLTAASGADGEERQTVCLAMLQIVKLLFTNRALTIRTRSDFSMDDMLHYLTEHCEEKITLESLSERFSISPSHLSRVFQNAFHCSPINYLINARMARATEYLGKTNKSVTEISELVGYDNHFHFTKLFTKRIGCTPAEYRERLGSRDLPKESEDIFYHRS